MEYDVASDFDSPVIVIVVGYPDEVSFCVLGVPEENSVFTARLEFCEMRGDNATCALRSEDVKIGEVGAMVEPKSEGSRVGS